MTSSLLENLFAPGTIERLGWMLVHVLWQATAVALLLALFLRLLHKAGANARYTVACSALALMVALPLVTLGRRKAPGPVAEAGPAPVRVALPMADAPAVQPMAEQVGWASAHAENPRTGQQEQLPAPLETADLSVPIPLQERIVSALEPALPYVVLGWLVGVFGLSAWHLGGWAQLQRLRRRMVGTIGAPLQRRLADLSARLGVRRAVGLLESALVEVPTVVGWLRPVILLPASALTGLRPEQLEAILAHELAHIRRYDYLVNMLQTVVEILGFYHPAVWWVSHRIRIERENCCDDLAVHVCGSTLQYARALACMEEIRHHGADLAVAATGGSLMARIARLLGRPAAEEDRRFTWLPGLIALLLVAGVIIPAALVVATPQPARSTEATASPAPLAALSSTEPNPLFANTEGIHASSHGEAAQVLLEFRFFKVLDGPPPDRTLLHEMAQALGNQSALAQALQHPDRGLDMSLDAILRKYVVLQSLSEPAFQALNRLLQSHRDARMLAAPGVLTRDGEAAEVRIADWYLLPQSVPSVAAEKIECGTVVNVTPQVLDGNRVALKLMAQISDLLPGPDANEPAVARTSAETSLTAWNDRYLIWAAIESPATQTDPGASRPSTYILVKPHVNLPPGGLAKVPADREPNAVPLRQVRLDVRTVTMERGGLVNLNVEWNWPTTQAGVFPDASAPAAGSNWPASVRIGHTADRAVTESLLGALELLQKDRLADISSQQILAQDRRESRIKAITEEWFIQATSPGSPASRSVLQKVESGTVLAVTPYIGDHNDIMLKMSVEVSESMPQKARGTDLPVVTRRMARNTVTIRDGGTIALAGLVEKRTGPNDKSTREVAIFVTAHLADDVAPTVPQTPPPAEPPAQEPPNPAGTSDRQATITATFTNADILSVLAEISERTGVAITPDATVKATPVTAQLVEASPKAALQQVLKNTPYTWVGDGSYLVFRPLSLAFPQVGLVQALRDPSVAADVPIIPDPNVTGTVNVTFEYASLDWALGMLLAGKPYVFKRMPGYYLVASRDSISRLPAEPFETHRIRLPAGAKLMIPPALVPYVQVEHSGTQDPNDQGNTLLVTASPERMGKIEEVIRQIDRPGGQVLLEARVVVMDQNDLRNIGVEWNGPTDRPDLSADRPLDATAGPAGNPWPWGVQFGCTADRAFTDSLMMALNLLRENRRADVIASPRIMAQDSRLAQMKIVQDQWYMMVGGQRPGGPQRQKMESGTVLSITPRVGEANDIKLEMAVDINDTIPKVRGNHYLPVITRRTATGSLTIQDGGTVAVAGLPQSEPGRQGNSQRHLVLFVTAHLVNDNAATHAETPPTAPAVRLAPKITATFTEADLHEVLAEIAEHGGVKITTDATVKPVQVTAEMVNAPVEAALRQVLKDTLYTARKTDNGTHLVFRPLSFTFPRVELVQALQDLSTAAGVPIIPDPNVTGTVSVTFKNISLDEALEMLLAGKPYTFKFNKTPCYYLVASRDFISRPETSDTGHLWPSYVPPMDMRARLGPVFAPYTQAEPSLIQDPRDQDSTLFGTAPVGLADRTAEETKPLDDSGNLVLLDTHVVVLEQSDLQNLPVERGWMTPARLSLSSSAAPSIKIGYAPDRASTDSLMVALNGILEKDRISLLWNRKAIARDGRRTRINLTQEEWSNQPPQSAQELARWRAQLQEILPGAILSITPYVGKHSDIAVDIVLDANDPKGGTRRLAHNTVILLDGGTAAIAGLTKDFPGYKIEPSREPVVFVTAHLIPEPREASLPTPSAQPVLHTPTAVISAEQVVNLRREYMNSDPLVRELVKTIVATDRELIILHQTHTPTHPTLAQKNALLEAFRRKLDKRRAELQEEFDRSMQERVSSARREAVNADPMVVFLSKRICKTEIDLIVQSQTLAPNHRTVVTMNTVLELLRRELAVRRAKVEQEFDKGRATGGTLAQGARPEGRGTRGEEPSSPAPSQAWHILRQWNCPPLLLGLTQQLAKVLEPARRNDPVWQEVSEGGTLRLKLDVEGDPAGDVIVGLFKDARWSGEPVAVRRLGAGMHVLTGLPAGRYVIGAMIGNAPVPAALGVHRTWPAAVEIEPKQTATADVLVSEAFQKWASGWYNIEVAKDYVSQWSDLDQTNLLQGQLTGPDGKPIPFGLVEIIEHNPGARSRATADQGTNEQGIFKYDGMNWPYQITALWRESIPSAWGYRRQRMYLSRVLEGPQRQDFRFEPFPEGTAKVAGRMIDQNGKPVQSFFLRVYMPPFSDLDLSHPTGGYKTQVTYDVPVISEDGKFELGGLPAGRATVTLIPFEVPRYQHERGKDVTLEAGQTAQVDVELVGKAVFHGRVVFEDGTPAVITPAPWRGAVTRIMRTFGPRAGSIGEANADGYFTVYLDDSEREALAQGDSRLLINVPTDQEHRWDTVGTFPFEKLAEDKDKAGVLTVKRPPQTPTLPAPRLPGPAPSQAWHILRQWNCPPLLLGLTQQLEKVLEPGRRNDAVWQEVGKGGTLRLKLEVEGDLPGEVVVGFFQDAKWSAPPVAVRRLSAGTHVLTGLPAGQYQIGAMLGDAPLPVALGVQRTWPEPVEIRPNETATAEALVSEAFQQHASGWYNEEVAKDYLGVWSDLDENNLLQGQLTGPDGRPIPFGEIMIREHRTDDRGFAALNRGTNEQGLYKFDGMAWPYRVIARWREPLPSSFGQHYQTMSLNRVLEGPQKLDFRFEAFPQGTAKLAGRVLDQNGKPVEGFFLRVLMLSSDELAQAWKELNGKFHTYSGYEIPFVSKEGTFELGGLPAGAANVHVIPFEGRRYGRDSPKDVSLTAGQTASLDFSLAGKGVYYGRVLFEDGTPAVVRPTPWKGAVTRIQLGMGFRALTIGEVDAEGYVTLYLDESQRQAIAAGSSRLVIAVPTDQERRWEPAGDLALEKLAEDKSQAGVVTVKRPPPTPTLPAALRRGGPLPPGWRLAYQPETRPDRRHMTQVLLETRPAPSDAEDRPTPDEEQFELYGPDGKRVVTLGSRSTAILDKAQPYTLIARPSGDLAPDDWRLTRGPFLVDLSRPGRYILTVDLSTRPAADPDSREMDASAVGPGGTRAFPPTVGHEAIAHLLPNWWVEPWGPPVEGVQIRLRATRHDWRADEIPAFRWDVRNAGTRQYLYVPADQSRTQLEVDGVWHVWPIPMRTVRLADLGVGQSLDDQLVTLSPMWSRARPQDLQPRGGGARGTDPAQIASSLQLAPGKHTIRLAVLVEPSRVDTGDVLRVVSPPMEITIAPPAAGTAAAWPPGSKLAQAVKETLESGAGALAWSAQPEPFEIHQWTTQASQALAVAREAAARAENTPLHASVKPLVDALAALQQALAKDPNQAIGRFPAVGKAYHHLVNVFSGEIPPTLPPKEAADAARPSHAAPDAKDPNVTNDAPSDLGSSRAWYIMRQLNGPPLLLGLTQQLLKTLQSTRQDDAMWQEVAGGGSLTLDVKVEHETGREIVVGLFQDAKGSQEPVAVRLLPREGTYTLTGLPPGRYQIGAMIGRAPSAAALGVQKTWPEAIEIHSGQTTTAELLVSRDFARNASGGYNREVSRDYTGDWSLLDENHLLQGRLTGPGGAPIAFGQVQVREYQAVPTGSIAAPNLGTNEDGLYEFDGMKWPYRMGAIWRDPLPAALGSRYQYKNINRVLEGPQKLDIQFDPFPHGTARIAGRVTDQHGSPVREFFLRVKTLGFIASLHEGRVPEPDGRTYTEFGYTVPFLSTDGNFELGGLPEGPVAVDAVAFDGRRYRVNPGKEVTLAAGQTTTIQVELTRNTLLYGRVLFEDGHPAVISHAPWEGARTTMRIDETVLFGQPVGHSIHDVGEADAEGYIAAYFRDTEVEHLRSGSAQLRLRLPGKYRDQWQSAGSFPFDKLSEDKARAGTVTIRRPES